MIKKQAQKSSRLALFSENERAYLNGKKFFDTVGKSQFHHNLDLRFDALLKDLDLLRRSKKLRSWRSLRARYYDHYFRMANYFVGMFIDVSQAYQSAIRHFYRGKEKNKKSYYWLDQSSLKDKKIDERVFSSKHLFRHIKKELSEKDKNTLLRSYQNQGILPLKKEDATPLQEIKKRLSGESKVRTNVKQITKVTKDTYKDSRNYEIYKIIEKHRRRSIKALNKKLTKYDSKIIQYLVNPFFHGESE